MRSPNHQLARSPDSNRRALGGVQAFMLMQDLRFAVRSFLRAPRFTVPAVLALALGIGATSAIFSVVRGVMLKPLPYRDPDRIVTVWENNAAAQPAAQRHRRREFRRVARAQPIVRVPRHGRSDADSTSSSTVSRKKSRASRRPPTCLPRSASSPRSAGSIRRRKICRATIASFWSATSSGRRGSADARDVLGLDDHGERAAAVGRRRHATGVHDRGSARRLHDSVRLDGGAAAAAPGRGSSHGIARLRDGVSLEQASRRHEDDRRAAREGGASAQHRLVGDAGARSTSRWWSRSVRRCSCSPAPSCSCS